MRRFLEETENNAIFKDVIIDQEEKIENKEVLKNKTKSSFINFKSNQDREPRLVKPLIFNVDAIGIAPKEFITQLHVYVNKDGVGAGARVIESGIPRYDTKARKAVENAKYYPGRKMVKKKMGGL